MSELWQEGVESKLPLFVIFIHTLYFKKYIVLFDDKLELCF